MILAKFSRWLLIVTCLLEGLFFCLITYALFRFEMAFKAQWLRPNLVSTVEFISIGVLFFCAAYLIFRRRRWGRYLAALLFLGELVWIFVDTFSDVPPDWDKLVWAAPLAVSSACLVYALSKRELWNLKEVS